MISGLGLILGLGLGLGLGLILGLVMRVKKTSRNLHSQAIPHSFRETIPSFTFTAISAVSGLESTLGLELIGTRFN